MASVVQSAIIVAAAMVAAHCGGKSPAPTAPSTTPVTPAPAPIVPTPAPSVVQGSTNLTSFQFAVINFGVELAGTLTSRVDWGNAANDIDTVILRGRCTVTQILDEAPGCTETATVVIDEGDSKPSVLSSSVQSGDHTLLIFNFGPGTDSATYRLEGFVTNATGPATSPPITIPTPTPTPTPAPPSTLCVPTLLSPQNGAQLDNGRQDSKDKKTWDFDWSDCSQATEYHLYVLGPSASIPFINQTGLTQSSYRSVSCSYVADRNRNGWVWRVRAKTGGGWGDWSRFNSFDVEPVDTDAPQPCP